MQSSVTKAIEEAREKKELRRAKIAAELAAKAHAREQTPESLRTKRAAEKNFEIKQKVANATQRVTEAAELQSTLKSATKKLSRVRFDPVATLKDANKLSELLLKVDDLHDALHDLLPDDAEETPQEPFQPASLLDSPLPMAPR